VAPRRRPVKARVRHPAPLKRKPRLRKETVSPRARWAVRLLVVALLGALAAAGVFGRQWYQQRQLDTGRQQALAAARQVTVDFVSISAATIDQDLKRIADGATGEFRDEFTRDMPQVRAAVVENKVQSKGTVLRAAVVSSDARTAVVLVALDANVKNAKAPDGRLSHYRIQVSLARDAGSGRWLVSQLQFVG
jgi:Mce-associated membrane protein